MSNARLQLQLVKLIPRVGRGLAAALGLAVVAQAALPLVFTVGTGVLIGSVPGTVERGLSSTAGHRLVSALAVLSVVLVLQEVAAPLSAAVSETIGRRLDGLLRMRAMSAMLAPHGVAHLEDPSVLDNAALARGAMDGAFTPGGAVRGIATNAMSVISSFASAVLVARFNIALAIALAATWRMVRFVLLRQFFKQVRTMIGQEQVMRKSSYFRDLAMTPGAAKEGRVFGLAGWIGTRFTQHWTEGMAEVWRARRGGLVAVMGVIALVGLGNVVAYAAVGLAAIDGRIGIGELALLLQAILGIGHLSIGDADLHVAYGLVALPALDGLDDVSKRAEIRAGARSDVSEMPRDAIRFEGVTFQYTGRDVPVLASLDLDIAASRSLAIVGENGAGKTTLIKLLCGLYAPTSGRITVDGFPLEAIDPVAWSTRVAAIFQDFVRYELSAADNVALGSRREADARAIGQALERAGATTVTAELPSGIDTVLSRRFGGVDLSGGQWQRIALARALFAVGGGAGVLILDEPTANLDVRAEAEIYDRFLEITKGLTTIVISHRFSTVRRADRIVVVEHGSVVEDGTHDSLLEAGGRYASMFRLQAERFAQSNPSSGQGEDEA